MVSANGRIPKDVPDDKLDEKERKRLTRPRAGSYVIGQPFDAADRLFPTYDSGKIFDTGIDLPEGPRKIKDALRRSGQMRALEQILTLPLRAADFEVRTADGGAMEAALIDENLVNNNEMLNRVVDQATAAVAYRHAFFEKEWEIVGQSVYYKDLHWRPPASCEVGWDPKTGRQEGFRQRTSGLETMIEPYRISAGRGSGVGYVDIPRSRAFIYTHGTHREPIRGVSDLDVAYWAYEAQQKILFLWFQFLEGQSLPKMLAYGDDMGTAEENADAIAAGKASAVIAMQRPGDPTLKSFEVIESSGAGAGQFLDAINWLDGQMTKSVLASFLDLANVATSTGTGSYALSADQSEFFLASRQAVANEIANSIEQHVFKPLCVFNFGVDAKPPKLSIGPLSKQDTDRALDLLKTTIVAPQVNAPDAFLGALLKSTATWLGLDEEDVRKMVDDYTKRVEKLPLQRELAAQNAQSQQQMSSAQHDLTRANTDAVKVKSTVDAATQAVARTAAGQEPKDAAKAVATGTGNGR